jgi:GNAT superfamily N-acetyltransferase
MPDMLVKLYNLPDSTKLTDKLKNEDIEIRHPLPPEKHIVINWVRNNFSEGWASECEKTFSTLPVTSYIAVRDGKILGFACYEATCKNFFGPTGVLQEARGSGIGAALLLRSLESLREQGYAYAVIGGVGPADFYSKVAGAVLIENSSPGIYKGMLKK